jgi:RNA polymerase sigma-70 factor, ECF subfamily
VQQPSPAVDARSATTAGPSSAFSSVAEVAFGLASCLRPTDPLSLIQVALAEAQRNRRKPGEDLRVWFFRALVRAYRDTDRARDPLDGDPRLDDTPDLYLYARSAAAGDPMDGPDPAAGLLERLGPERVVAALARLAEEYRLVCSCYFLGNLSYVEMAAVLEYPVGAVRARLHRGRRMLQKALWQVAGEDGLTPPPPREATP